MKLWTIDTFHFKRLLFSRLRRTVNAREGEAGGARYMHFCMPTKTGADGEFFAQFGAEMLDYKRVAGRRVPYFREVRKRNEAIDLEEYALAGLYTLGETVIERLGELADRLSEPLVEEDRSEAGSRPPEPPVPQRRGGSGWVNGWRR